jgi:hypothetical protein
MKVESQLEVALAKAVTKTVDSIDTAAGFLAAQAPEVISQLLLWHGIKSALVCAIGMVMLYVIQYIGRHYLGPGDKIDPGKEDRENNYRQTLTHNEDGEWCVRTLFTACVGVIGFFIGLNLITSNLDWLQILVAEKIWLLEYAAKIIKK